MNSVDVRINNPNEEALTRFLEKLNILKTDGILESLHPSSPGCELSVKSYGILKKIAIATSLEQAENSFFQGILYFASFRPEQIQALCKTMDRNLNFRIYLLCHNYYDCLTEIEKLIMAGIDSHRITFLVSQYPRLREIKAFEYLENRVADFKFKEVFLINANEPKKNRSRSRLLQNLAQSYFVLTLIKWIIAPIKVTQEKLRPINLVWFDRFKELIHFINYIFKIVLEKVRVQVRYALHFCRKGFFGLWYLAARIFYGTRHLILMTCFKSYGIAVDFFHLSLRVGNKLFWILRHTLFYPFLKIYWFTSFQVNKRILKK